MPSYDPATFWEPLVGSRPDLTGVGHGGFGPRYNEYLYRAKERALARCNVPAAGKHVLDVGSGTGYFASVLKQLGAASYTGLDITASAGDRLRAIEPSARFVNADIGSAPISAVGTFDLVLMFDVAYHIVEPERFATALDNVWSFVAPGGHLLLVDSFWKTDLVPATPPGSVAHVVFHKRSDYDELLFSRSDCELLELVPMYYLFNRPIVGDRFPWTSKRLSWQLRYRLFESRAVLRAMFALDGVLAPHMPGNPSLKIAVARKRG